MSGAAEGRRSERCLARLAVPGAVLAPDEGEGYGVFPDGDRRRRPLARMRAADVRAMLSDGAIELAGQSGGYVLSAAGRKRLARRQAAPGEAYAAQHGEIGPRSVADALGRVATARGYVQDTGLRRLAALRGRNGRALLDASELAAAARLRDDWERAQVGLVRGADWTAPPLGSAARGPGSAREAAMAAACDARRRVALALEALEPVSRRVIERTCLREESLSGAAEGKRLASAKAALKAGLARIAALRL